MMTAGAGISPGGWLTAIRPTVATQSTASVQEMTGIPKFFTGHR